MDEIRRLHRIIEQQARQIADLMRRVCNLPVRFGAGGGGGASDMFDARVVWDGTGFAGDRTNPTSWKYHVIDDAGNQIATSLTPIFFREVGVRRFKADNLSACVCAYDANGAVVLIAVQEEIDRYECATGA